MEYHFYDFQTCIIRVQYISHDVSEILEINCLIAYSPLGLYRRLGASNFVALPIAYCLSPIAH